MTNLVEEAMVEIDERFKNITGQEADTGLDDDQVKLMLAGCGINFDELEEVMEIHIMNVLAMIVCGVSPRLAVKGVFLQAFLAGHRYKEKQIEQNKKEE